jgi:hypothetical protein
MLLGTGPESLTLIEPSEMFSDIEKSMSDSGAQVFNTIFEKARSRIETPDTIIYVNVLEHIEDDVRELQLIRETLGDGGRCLLFVPAMRALFSDFDRDLGHFRRYTKRELEDKVRSAGFKILRSRYFDFAGVAPWFVKYRIMRSRSLGGGAVALYDSAVVPLMRHIEAFVDPPFGKNILLAAGK